MDISHIESRPSRRPEAAFEIYLRCNGQKNAITVLTNTLKQSSSILDLTLTANDEESKGGYNAKVACTGEYLRFWCARFGDGVFRSRFSPLRNSPLITMPDTSVELHRRFYLVRLICPIRLSPPGTATELDSAKIITTFQHGDTCLR